MAQLNLFDEGMARDQALDLLQRTRSELIADARVVADSLAATHGTVTAPMVFAALREAGRGEQMATVDPRWMGVVFRSGWERVGYRSSGSHRRPVSVWRRKQ